MGPLWLCPPFPSSFTCHAVAPLKENSCTHCFSTSFKVCGLPYAVLGLDKDTITWFYLQPQKLLGPCDSGAPTCPYLTLFSWCDGLIVLILWSADHWGSVSFHRVLKVLELSCRPLPVQIMKNCYFSFKFCSFCISTEFIQWWKVQQTSMARFPCALWDIAVFNF